MPGSLHRPTVNERGPKPVEEPTEPLTNEIAVMEVVDRIYLAETVPENIRAVEPFVNLEIEVTATVAAVERDASDPPSRRLYTSSPGVDVYGVSFTSNKPTS